jgi:hypothetical protein
MPDVKPRLFLLDCSEPEERIKVQWPRFWEYLQTGRAQKIEEAYLTSRRSPWYSQEQRPPAPFLCTYMGRSRNGKHPFRFIWNRSQATAHNVYLMLYPQGALRTALKEYPELQSQVFEALQSIEPAQFISEGRVYGGGLHKVEPKELAQIPAHQLLDSIQAHVRIEAQMPMLFT